MLFPNSRSKNFDEINATETPVFKQFANFHKDSKISVFTELESAAKAFSGMFPAIYRLKRGTPPLPSLAICLSTLKHGRFVFDMLWFAIHFGLPPCV